MEGGEHWKMIQQQLNRLVVYRQQPRTLGTLAGAGESSAIAAGAVPFESGYSRCCHCFSEPFQLFVEVFLDQIGYVGLFHG